MYRAMNSTANEIGRAVYFSLVCSEKDATANTTGSDREFSENSGQSPVNRCSLAIVQYETLHGRNGRLLPSPRVVHESLAFEDLSSRHSSVSFQLAEASCLLLAVSIKIALHLELWSKLRALEVPPATVRARSIYEPWATLWGLNRDDARSRRCE